MRRWAWMIAVGCAGLAAAAQAQTWHPVARDCARQYAAWFYQMHHYPCASCSAGWPEIARCTAKTADPAVNRSQVEACITRVNDADWRLPMAHDRVADVMSCLGR